VARFVGRRVVPVVLGVGIWLLSLPLLTGHAPNALPAVAGATVATTAATLVPAARHVFPARPKLVVGQLATPTPTAEPAVPAASAVMVAANWLYIPRLGLSQPVGWYSDCLGSAPVPRWGTWRWSCAGANNTYVMAHNPGVFTPILGLHAGDLIEYGDPRGALRVYRVTFTTIVANTELWPLRGVDRASLTLQTCWTWDGTRDFIVRGVQI
jgi:Sortase domain